MKNTAHPLLRRFERSTFRVLGLSLLCFLLSVVYLKPRLALHMLQDIPSDLELLEVYVSSRRYVPSYIGMHTVHTYRSYAGGEPYGYLPEIYVQPVYRPRTGQAVRDAMEDGQEYISIFNERGNCTGLWINEQSPSPMARAAWSWETGVCSSTPEEEHQELFTNAVNRLLKR